MSLTADISKSNLTINRLTKAQFDELDGLGQIKDNEIYLVEETELNAQNKRLTNLLSGSTSCDAVTLGQLSSYLQQYYKTTETSSANEISIALENVSVDLSEYYTKSETSSASEISIALENVSVDLSEYYTKSETSSAEEISGALSVLESNMTKVMFRHWSEI